MIIDIYSHHISNSVGKILLKSKHSGAGKVIQSPPQNADPAVRLGLMDKYGMGVVVKETDLNEELMVHTIMDFHKDRSKLGIMRANCEKMDLSKTMEAISSVIKHILE